MFRCPLIVLVVASICSGGCSNVECDDNEIKVADTCYAKRDAGSTPNDASILEQPGSLDGQIGDAAIRRDSAWNQADGDVSSAVDARRVDAVAGADAGSCAPPNCVEAEAQCRGRSEPELAKTCWVDRDGDGYAALGASAEESCGECGTGRTSRAPSGTNNIDCDDTAPDRSPQLTDVCGDAIDNDCDGIADNDATNACGGPCTTQLAGRPGDACTNGLRGICERTGALECTSTDHLRCTAAATEGTAEVCDGVDNDCDGQVDEGVKNACGGCTELTFAPGTGCTSGTGACASSGQYRCESTDSSVCDATPKTGGRWYADCDADGYATSAAGAVEGCSQPMPSSTCKAWTSRAPSAAERDCDDTNPRRYPGAAFAITGGGNGDLNCDEKLESKLELVTTTGGTTGARGEFRLCTVEEASNARCSGCYGSTAIHDGFNGFGQRPSREIIPFISWVEGTPPCSGASDYLLIINEMTPTCDLLNEPTFAVRHLCR